MTYLTRKGEPLWLPTVSSLSVCGLRWPLASKGGARWEFHRKHVPRGVWEGRGVLCRCPAGAIREPSALMERISLRKGPAMF